MEHCDSNQHTPIRDKEGGPIVHIRKKHVRVAWMGIGEVPRSSCTHGNRSDTSVERPQASRCASGIQKRIPRLKLANVAVNVYTITWNFSGSSTSPSDVPWMGNDVDRVCTMYATCGVRNSGV